MLSSAAVFTFHFSELLGREGVHPDTAEQSSNDTPRPASSQAIFAGVLRGNTIRGNTTRNSERKICL